FPSRRCAWRRRHGIAAHRPAGQGLRADGAGDEDQSAAHAGEGAGELAVRICIYGAGASGGHFAVRLARAGHEGSVIARGPHLAAIRERGLQMRTGGEALAANVAAGDAADDFGPQDVVIVATKATALPAIA